MRIALAGTFVGRGGIQTHLGTLANVLVANGHEILLLSFGGPRHGDKNEITDILPSAPERGIQFVGEDGRVATFLAVRQALRNFRPDAYFACGTGWNLFAGAIICRVRQRIFHEVMSGESSGWRDSRQLVRKFFHRVVAQAHPVAENFARSFDWRKPIVVIPAFSQPLEECAPAQKHSVPQGSARAGIFGRLVPHKRVGWLVEQWPRLRKSLRELHIHGTGPEEGLIRDLIKRNSWDQTVFLHGAYPSGNAYADLLASYDLTLLPTIGAEGAPLVLLESMACGVPFVATDAGGIRDYTNPDCVVTVASESEDFLEGVRTLAARLAHAEVDQGRLQQFYRSQFGYDALAARWESFFDSLEQ